jgi:transposase
MPLDAIVIGLQDVEILSFSGGNPAVLRARYVGRVSCPHCGGEKLRKKAFSIRRLRHASFGLRPVYLELESRKYQCLKCERYFNQRFPGIGVRRRSTEPFRRQIVRVHEEGISQRTLAAREKLGSATIERWYQEHLAIKVRERVGADCPRVLGIDEHFFTRKDGFATTFCDLGRRKIYDVALGRSEKALEGFLRGIPGKAGVRVVCMDLAEHYRALARKHFPQALIVADRFHVVRLVNQHFIAVWALLDPQGRKNRGLLSLIRRHPKHLDPQQVVRLQQYLDAQPAFAAIYAFKQKLMRVLLFKTINQRKAKRLAPYFLWMIEQLRASKFAALATLGRTLWEWRDEIARMWRFTKNNGITEGFHTKMEMISRRAYGFRNFENYRLRVRVLCS